MTPAEYAVAKVKLESYCAYQERCLHEVHEKIKSFDLSEKQVEVLILELQNNNFLNEERFARSYASGKFAIKSWGKIKIKAHLQAKYVSAQFIKYALDDIDMNEYLKRIENLAQRKFTELLREKDPWIKKQKVMRFLAGKGYETNLIYDVLDMLKN